MPHPPPLSSNRPTNISNLKIVTWQKKGVLSLYVCIYMCMFYYRLSRVAFQHVMWKSNGCDFAVMLYIMCWRKYLVRKVFQAILHIGVGFLLIFGKTGGSLKVSAPCACKVFTDSCLVIIDHRYVLTDRLVRYTAILSSCISVFRGDS